MVNQFAKSTSLRNVVAAIIKGNDFVVPRGDKKVEANERVVFVGPTAATKKAH